MAQWMRSTTLRLLTATSTAHRMTLLSHQPRCGSEVARPSRICAHSGQWKAAGKAAGGATIWSCGCHHFGYWPATAARTYRSGQCDGQLWGARMSAGKVRRGMPSVQLTKEEFGRRYRDRFRDPACAEAERGNRSGVHVHRLCGVFRPGRGTSVRGRRHHRRREWRRRGGFRRSDRKLCGTRGVRLLPLVASRHARHGPEARRQRRASSVSWRPASDRSIPRPVPASAARRPPPL